MDPSETRETRKRVLDLETDQEGILSQLRLFRRDAAAARERIDDLENEVRKLRSWAEAVASMPFSPGIPHPDTCE